MIFRIIAALIWGIAIGVSITNILNKRKKSNNNSKVEILEDLIKVYEVHEEELKEKINYYKDGMHEALDQNIDLRRRLNNGNSSKI